jgi:hypothetical protein
MAKIVIHVHHEAFNLPNEGQIPKDWIAKFVQHNEHPLEMVPNNPCFILQLLFSHI